MMQLSYLEPVMIEKGFNINKNKCPIAEDVQKRSMLFKTNYRSISEAEKYINILKKSLDTF